MRATSGCQVLTEQSTCQLAESSPFRTSTAHPPQAANATLSRIADLGRRPGRRTDQPSWQTCWKEAPKPLASHQDRELLLHLLIIRGMRMPPGDGNVHRQHLQPAQVDAADCRSGDAREAQPHRSSSGPCGSEWLLQSSPRCCNAADHLACWYLREGQIRTLPAPSCATANPGTSPSCGELT